MDTKTILHALALPEDASDRDILDRIEGLRSEAGEEVDDDLNDIELIRRGEHERVSIDGRGATVELYFPIKSGTEVITQVLMRRPKARELRRMTEAKENGKALEGLAKTLVLIADLTGRAPKELEDLDAADWSLLTTVSGFLQRPPRRTGTSS